MAQTETYPRAALDATDPTIRRIETADLMDALSKGIIDFRERPSYRVLVAVIYPVIGLAAIFTAANRDLAQLIFPLAAGFALVGPFAALGFYELSRQRELNPGVHWSGIFRTFRGPSLRAALGLGVVLLVIFFVWLRAAEAIFAATLGPAKPATLGQIVDLLFSTREGWMLILAGNAVGFLFACAVLAISVVSFPMILDRSVGVMEAVVTSLRATIHNLRIVALWGLIVALALVLGSLPFLLGLTVVLPVLGHATWHLYRKLVV